MRGYSAIHGAGIGATQKAPPPQPLSHLRISVLFHQCILRRERLSRVYLNVPTVSPRNLHVRPTIPRLARKCHVNNSSALVHNATGIGVYVKEPLVWNDLCNVFSESLPRRFRRETEYPVDEL